MSTSKGSNPTRAFTTESKTETNGVGSAAQTSTYEGKDSYLSIVKPEGTTGVGESRCRRAPMSDHYYTVRENADPGEDEIAQHSLTMIGHPVYERVPNGSEYKIVTAAVTEADGTPTQQPFTVHNAEVKVTMYLVGNFEDITKISQKVSGMRANSSRVFGPVVPPGFAERRR
jgi:hypothetical protein